VRSLGSPTAWTTMFLSRRNFKRDYLTSTSRDCDTLYTQTLSSLKIANKFRRVAYHFEKWTVLLVSLIFQFLVFFPRIITRRNFSRVLQKQLGGKKNSQSKPCFLDFLSYKANISSRTTSIDNIVHNKVYFTFNLSIEILWIRFYRWSSVSTDFFLSLHCLMIEKWSTTFTFFSDTTIPWAE